VSSPIPPPRPAPADGLAAAGLPAAPSRLAARIRELEARLAHASRLAALGQRVAQVAHEVRAPLGGIEGFAALLQRDLAPDDPRRGSAARILTAVQGLRRLVDDLLAFGRPPAARVRPVSARAVLEEALALVQEERRHLGLAVLSVERRYAREADGVLADPDALRQALVNLLRNASQAMGALGTLALSIRPTPGPRPASTLALRDSGPGIPAALREKVFDPFFTTRSGGTGLGLASARSLVELCGGWLELASDPGRGTTALVTLPLHVSEIPASFPEGHLRLAAGHGA
jgi:signal transduction histidine kinase